MSASEELISNGLSMQDVTVTVPSHRPALAREVDEALAPLQVVHLDGTGYPSFAKLINDCIVQTPTEVVVICSDKVRPSRSHIDRMVAQLNEGYAFVGPYYFACFCFTKELIRRIGFLDERFKGGECEDADFMVRMREADLAYHVSKEVPYIAMGSSWDNSLTRGHFIRKWGTLHMHEAVRQLPEDSYDYDLGPSREIRFLPSSRTQELH